MTGINLMALHQMRLMHLHGLEFAVIGSLSMGSDSVMPLFSSQETPKIASAKQQVGLFSVSFNVKSCSKYAIVYLSHVKQRSTNSI